MLSMPSQDALLATAKGLEDERQLRSPVHGMPIILKVNFTISVCYGL